MWRHGGGPSRLTWRRLGVLIKGLPTDSLTKTRIRDEVEVEYDDKPAAFGPWSTLNYQIASVMDLLQDVAFAVYRANGGEPPEPERVPRPQPKGARGGKRHLSTEEASAIFDWFEQIRDDFDSQH